MSHPNSLDWNPIQTCEAMSSQDEIVYVPFAFGYSNYSRTGLAKPLHFCDIAGPGPDPLRGALLGGAGCAVTRSAQNLPQITDYLRFVHDPKHQRTDYFALGGQPGSRAAWLDDGVNAAVNGFFVNTLKTLDAAYLRPRHDGFIGFFETAGQILNAHFRGNSTRSAAILDLYEEYNRSWTIATH
jgi:multiple sugar transport system substrate-binding protein